MSPLLMLTLASTLAAAAVESEPIEPLLKTLCAVGPQAAGHREAARAWRQLAQRDARQLPEILAGLDAAGPLGANWICTAVDAVAERQLQQGGKLPAEAIEQFVLDSRHSARARRLAYEWLLRVDATASQRVVPKMLDDPSLELRRDAVARLIEEMAAAADNGDAAAVVAGYRRAFAAARDADQVQLLAARLRKLKQPVDLPRHFGFVLRWKVIGPFDNTGEKGFAAVYPPERQIDLHASYEGKHGSVGWIDCASKDAFGMIDLNAALGEEKGVVGYALAEFFATARREVQLRLASANAPKLWLNGQLLGEYRPYHSGAPLDQYVSRATLQPGRNVILVKACQNEQTQEWAKPWGFQLRVCDEIGTAILSTDVGH